jgi:hypothetical protein
VIGPVELAARVGSLQKSAAAQYGR